MNNNERLIRMKEVAFHTQLSKSYLYKLSADGQFPKSVPLVEGRGTSPLQIASNQWP
jgi:predicted DNA-binding transcriptional regulator AlpA